MFRKFTDNLALAFLVVQCVRILLSYSEGYLVEMNVSHFPSWIETWVWGTGYCHACIWNVTAFKVELRNSNRFLLLSSLHCCRQRPKRGERTASSAFACWWKGCQASGWSRKEYHCRRCHLILKLLLYVLFAWYSNLVWTVYLIYAFSCQASGWSRKEYMHLQWKWHYWTSQELTWVI